MARPMSTLDALPSPATGKNKICFFKVLGTKPLKLRNEPIETYITKSSSSSSIETYIETEEQKKPQSSNRKTKNISINRYESKTNTPQFLNDGKKAVTGQNYSVKHILAYVNIEYREKVDWKYWVEWKGYDIKDNTWESKYCFSNDHLKASFITKIKMYRDTKKINKGLPYCEECEKFYYQKHGIKYYTFPCVFHETDAWRNRNGFDFDNEKVQQITSKLKDWSYFSWNLDFWDETTQKVNISYPN